ncbi:hypothetical protein BRADI_2g11761v3 [Brachypodium distachyon]|uniref:Uncharacterized protein n=1 Tax=Brachypodium distachyon TaxID=15368 RepID=A0A0Q3K035_BRADI|nr:hypothetical protein BRADI_2g11761v3 [Brachypodium distachyon]KQK04113.1 hypothetical protein BRADI_2g11761v3 [Brachypodium distachyon]
MGRTNMGGISAYWKRRRYYRLDAGTVHRRRPLPTTELGGSAPTRRRRGWRLRRRSLGGRLLRALCSPRWWMARLRDVYCAAAACPEALPRPRQIKEYEEKVLVEMYMSILTDGGQLAVVGKDGPAAATLRVAAAV